MQKMLPVCQALSACAQFTSEQCNEMIEREWNIKPQPFFKTQVMSTTPNDIYLFTNNYSIIRESLETLLQSVTKVACDLAVIWNKEEPIFQQMYGVHFELTEHQTRNAWIFRHNHDLGFLIIPMLVAVQPAMVLIDLVVPVGPSVTECCGEPLQVRFFPKVLVHNALHQLFNVSPELLPHIIGMQNKVTHNSLVHQLLHLPTWNNIIRISLVAVQHLADARQQQSDLCILPSSPPSEPIAFDDLAETVDKGFECTSRSHPELFRVIQHGQLPVACTTPKKTLFTPANVFKYTNEVLQPFLHTTLYAANVPSVPMHEVATAAMNNFFKESLMSESMMHELPDYPTEFESK